MEQRLDLEQRVVLRPSFHQLVHNGNDGSIGGEIASGLCLTVLSIAYTFGWVNESSAVFAVFTSRFPGWWLLLPIFVGSVNLIALAYRAVFPLIIVRKLCTGFGFAVLVGVIWDLGARGSWAAAILLILLIVPMMLAVVRVRYEV